MVRLHVFQNVAVNKNNATTVAIQRIPTEFILVGIFYLDIFKESNLSGSPTFGVDEKSFKPILYKNTKRHMNISYAKI